MHLSKGAGGRVQKVLSRKLPEGDQNVSCGKDPSDWTTSSHYIIYRQTYILTCYTLKEVNTYKHDQGKALETIVIPDVKKTNANLVCLESGVIEATKIAKTPLMSWQR